MSTTGDIFCGTGENVDRGFTDWVSPSNITADDAADTTNTGESDYLVGRNYDFSAIPAGATINGVTTKIEASENSPATRNLNAQLQDDTAALIGSVKLQTISGNIKVVYTYGSSTDLWDATLTAAIVKHANFGTRFWYVAVHNIAADWVKMAIDYTASVAGQPLRMREIRTYPGIQGGPGPSYRTYHYVKEQKLYLPGRGFQIPVGV